jgi:hypothetical protein
VQPFLKDFIACDPDTGIPPAIPFPSKKPDRKKPDPDRESLPAPEKRSHRPFFLNGELSNSL